MINSYKYSWFGRVLVGRSSHVLQEQELISVTQKRSIYRNQSASNDTNKRQINCWTILNLICSSLLILLYPLETLAVAHEGKNEIDPSVLFQPPPGEEEPENTEGGGSRDDQSGACGRDIAQPIKSAGDRQRLTAIAPSGYDGLTTVKHPTFWINLPPTSASHAILLVKKGSNSNWHQSVTHSKQSISLVGKAGIVGIKLAEAAPPLKIGENYRWVVALVCGNQPNPNDPLVAAGIKRIDRSQVGGDMLTASTELDRASLYAKEGIWYDALDTLIAEKSALKNWGDIWLKYLRSGGLADKIADEPIVGHLDNN